MEKVYNVLVKDFNPNLDIEEDLNLYHAVSIMYEKGCVDEGFTKKDIEKFLEDR